MTARRTVEAAGQELLEVAIIGAGFSGLGLAIRLRQQGIHNFRVFEQSADVGGVWRDNIYPGAACDVPSHLYSFSFEPNPGWQRMFGGRDEIQAYLRHCADKYQLRPSIRFNTRIQSMAYDDVSGCWDIRSEDGAHFLARTAVLAIGALNRPAWPNIPGLDDFRGKLMHTAEWDPDCELAGKRVAVVGTGASAIQVVPAIQPHVSQLSVFQRTPPWVLPRRDRAISGRERGWFRRLPVLQACYRKLIYLFGEGVTPIFLWNSWLTRLIERMGRRYLKSQIQDPVLRAKLTPDYAIGCKRVLLSDDYYPAVKQGNVEVITESIRELREDAIVTGDGQVHPVDVIVMATGFQVPSAGAPFDIRGSGGRRLSDDWHLAAEAYKGVAVSGYPNLLYMMGPNTGPGNQSVIFYIEAQIGYILQYLKTLRAKRLKSLDIKPAVQQAFNRRLQQRMAGTTWTSGCSSWYLTAEGKNSTLWPGFSWQYYVGTRRFSLREYHCQPLPLQAESDTDAVRLSESGISS